MVGNVRLPSTEIAIGSLPRFLEGAQKACEKTKPCIGMMSRRILDDMGGDDRRLKQMSRIRIMVARSFPGVHQA